MTDPFPADKKGMEGSEINSINNERYSLTVIIW